MPHAHPAALRLFAHPAGAPRLANTVLPLLCRPLRAVRGPEGFIVFGCLILVVVVFVSAVLIGKLIYGPEPLNLRVGVRELRRATVPVPVRYGALEVHRLAPGDSVWVAPVEGGEVAIYLAPDALNVVGFAPDSLLVRAGAGR